MRVIVSVLVLKEGKLLIQTRFKPQASPAYTGMIEIPAGGVEDGEDVRLAVVREVSEETGLNVSPREIATCIENEEKQDKVIAFKPYLCQQMLKTKDGLLWTGFVFICDYFSGKLLANPEEAKDLRWIDKSQLADIVDNHPETVFPLQLPVLMEFLNDWEKICGNA